MKFEGTRCAGGAAPSRKRRPSLILAGVLISLVAGLTIPSLSLGAFTRPSLHQITQTPKGPFAGPGGLSTDAAENLWVGDGNTTLDEFAPSGAFVQEVTLKGSTRLPQGSTPPGSLAIEHATATESFYVSGPGTIHGYEPFVEKFDLTGTLLPWEENEFQGLVRVAVDNSTDSSEDPSACHPAPVGCSVYVAHSKQDAPSPAGDGELAGIEKFNAAGEPVAFSAAGTVPYVKAKEANDIAGTESGGFAFEELGGIAVSPEGDIFAVANETQLTTPTVLEYEPSGKFLRAFSGQETPGVGESREKGGWGGALEGVAIDPVSGHLLVSLTHFHEGGSSPEPVEGAIDEFDLGTGRYLDQITGIELEPEAGVHEFHPLRSAFEITADAQGRVYVADVQEHLIDEFGAGRFLPSVKIGEASERTTTGAQLNGTVNPEGLTLSGCQFEYVSDSKFKASGFASASSEPCVPAAGSIPQDSAPHPVHAAISGLTSGTTYHYRLVVSTEGALGGEAVSLATAFTAPDEPSVITLPASNLSSSFADVNAKINPLGSKTTYHFEYDTRPYEGPEAHGTSVPMPDEAIGSGGATGSSEEGVLEHLSGLTPDTTYYFRAVASNAVGVSYGEQESFTTLPVVLAGLPDGREYELVTPASKPGGSDMFALAQTNGEYFNNDTATPAEDGNGIVLHTHAGFGPFPGNEESAYVFTRAAGKWSYASLASPSLGVQNVFSFVFNPYDISQVGVNDEVGSIGSELGSQREALLGPPGGPYTTLHVDAPTHESKPKRTTIVGASHDLSHLVLETPSYSTCPGDTSQQHGEALCESSGGELHLLNVNSKGALFNSCGAVLGAGAEGGLEHNAVSSDGSRAIFTVPDPNAVNEGPGCWNGTTTNAPQLYMRVGTKTIELSAAQPGVSDPSGEHIATYVGASEDDSKVFFLTDAWLTADHPTGHGSEIYECEIVEEQPGQPTCNLSRVSRGETGSGGSTSGAEVNTVPAISADGTAVYYTAFAALAKGAQTLTPQHVAGEQVPVNLYRYDVEDGTTTYVTTVGTDDYPYQALQCSVADELPRAQCAQANWYTTPSGRYLLFASTTEVTHYHTTGPCEVPDSDGSHDGHCDELYRYDSATNEITCVSCDPSGDPPVSNALFARSAPDQPASGPVQAMSNDGSYVFFDTADELVPTDTDKTLDVYEWHEGKLALISSGKDTAPSFFLGSSSVGSEEGVNVFFGTHTRMVREDTDTSGDIYDARLCSGSDPCIKPPPGETAQCEGDACQVPPVVPLAANPSSSIFSGVGNVFIEEPAPAVKPPPKLTNAQKLSKALVACHKDRKARRKKCEAEARKRYGKKTKKAKKASHRKPGSSRRAGK
jgi:hypothetical protein